MQSAHRWTSVLVLIFLLVVAACAGKEENAQGGAADAEAAPLPTAITVTISSDGTITPDPIAPNPGDTVSFVADGEDVVLCVDPTTLFGAERYEIANGTTADLTVQATAIHISFAYSTCVGDLSAQCGGCRGGGEGGGTTGP